MTRRELIALAGSAAVSHAQMDVGNHRDWVQSLATAKPSLSWIEPRFTNLAAWTREARARYLGLLHYAPPKVDLRPTVQAKEDRGEYTVERISFSTTAQLRVPALVLAPKNPRGQRRPAIVAMHDHGGFYLWGKEKLVAMAPEHPSLTAFKKTVYAGRNIAEDLARAGYVVAVIDTHYWGERRMLVDGDGADWRERPLSMTNERVNEFNRRASANEQLMARTIEAAGTTWPGIALWDDLRTVDYLVSRPDVDPNRIGCVGLSVGAVRACYLAAADPRIQASAIICWMTSFPDQLRGKIIHTIGHTKLIPGLYPYLDYPDIASLTMPSALLVIGAGKDALFNPEGVRKAHEKLRACYRKAGIPDRLQCTMYPEAPHEFNAAMQAEAWKFLGRWLL